MPGADSWKVVKDTWNAFAAPLSVLFSTVQYFEYMRRKDVSHEQILGQIQMGGCQGFCIGLLAATAAANSNDEITLSRNVAVALRLAFCIGVYVDYDQTSLRGGPTSAFVLRRHRGLELDMSLASSILAEVDSLSHEIDTKVSDHDSPVVRSDSYIATRIDQASCTIIVPKSSITALHSCISSEDYTLKPLSLRARYHSPALRHWLHQLLAFCTKEPGLIFLETHMSPPPIHSNYDGRTSWGKPAHEEVLECIMARMADWHLVVSNLAERLRSTHETSNVLELGPVRCLQGSRTLGLLSVRPSFGLSVQAQQPSTQPPPRNFPDTAVAIVGMACKFPGADTLEELWDVIASGRSLCKGVPADRFQTNGLRRTPQVQKFFANLLNDVDAFDHRFFRKTSREAASMDPQQRLLLQVAYQALESANYFNGPEPPDKNVGCYIGVCANDYADNVASHPPNAFSTLGTLRAFMAGRISNFFGWSGESSTIDTACSSSAVAINKACTDIIAGKCSAALAGGVNVFTSPNFFQNLHAGKFLSTTGQCKSFDTKADGYCRGEGVGLVVLKKLSEALAAGDEILAVIPGSAVRQNSNETYITVPHGPSQSDLYEEVLRYSQMSPEDVTYVEAHGTGTPVGDPIEFESIRRTFGGRGRQADQLLHVGSIKGNIGHTESASGVAALIKAVLMIRHRRIPPQASFVSLNPHIALQESDRMAITTTGMDWKSQGPLTACVNNYGASGSNAALIVTEPPPRQKGTSQLGGASSQPYAVSYPFVLTASSQESLSFNAGALLKHIQEQSQAVRLGDLSFNLASRRNPSLPFATAFTASSLDQLSQRLHECGNSDKWQVSLPDKARPVVMAFGGQTSEYVALDEDFYRSCALFRHHLDRCQRELKRLGHPGIFPQIFQSEPIEDIVILHSALFSMQYSCANSWIDSGIKVARVLGHSFGELTAMCVSGILSLSDGLKLVAERARLMTEKWGPEPGSMLLVEASSHMLIDFAVSSSLNIEIACHNGPQSTVVCGSSSDIERAQKLIEQSPAMSRVRTKVLNVPYAFHSRFTEPILDQLESFAAGLTFRKPTIPMETCVDGATENLSWSQRIRQHTRRPVQFNKAVQIIHEELDGCCWLEAGANSGITSMVRKALGGKATQHVFCGITARESPSLRESLVQVTLDLWTGSHSHTFWDFHSRQRGQYSQMLLLPPYQFEKNRHWLEWRDTIGVTSESQSASKDTALGEAASRLLTLTKKTENSLEFKVDPHHDTWKSLVQGHAVVGQPLCPAPLYMELAAQAALVALEGEAGNDKLSPAWKNLHIEEALGIATDSSISLLLSRAEQPRAWNFSVVSSPLTNPTLPQSAHASGEVRLVTARQAEDESQFQQYETALRHTARQIQAADVAETVALRGPLVYSVFSRVVTYGGLYKGVWDVLAKGEDVIGRVRLPADFPFEGAESMVTNPLAMDNFVQVSGIHVNSLSVLCLENEVFVCTRIRKIDIHPQFSVGSSRRWRVLSMYRECDSRTVDNDIYVYDEETDNIVVVIQGARFTRMLIKSLVRALSLKNGSRNEAAVPRSPNNETKSPEDEPQAQPSYSMSPVDETASDSISDEDVFRLLARVAEIDLSAISNDASLADLGIDSLLSTEVLSEINETLSIEIPADEYQNMVSVGELVEGIRRRSSPGNSVSKRPTSSLPSRGVSPTFTEASTAASTGSSTPASVSSEFVAGKNILSPLGVSDAGPTAQLHDAYETFKHAKNESDEFTRTYGSTEFWTDVYPRQASLVTQYVVEAFPELGCDISVFKAGDELPPIKHAQKNAPLAAQLFEILADARLVRRRGKLWVRTDAPVPQTPASDQLREMLEMFPGHASEHKLLSITGSHLAACMTGAADVLDLVFRKRENAGILEDVYTNGPFYLAAGKQLCSFLQQALLKKLVRGSGQPIQILEIGGGTASTTKHVLKMLSEARIPFVYTFTDVAAALVAGAKRKLPGLISSSGGKLEFQTLNISKDPPSELRGKFDLVISTNCIHATADLTASLTNIKRMLSPTGIVSLVEFTKNLYWFDLVFGLMDGWWSMTDGRKHVLADEFFWKRCFQNAGFEYVDWTGGELAESNMLRIITGFQARPEIRDVVAKKRFEIETVMFKQTGQNRLFADIYLPPSNQQSSRVWSVGESHVFRTKQIPLCLTSSIQPTLTFVSKGLLLHGGGHITLSRHDINTKYIQRMLDDGILPVSVDYRLCPETRLLEGPMADACSALEWARNELPLIDLGRPDIDIGSKVVAAGWSSGGHLAMSLAWTAPEQQVAPPEAVLAFYSPSYLEHESWTKPNFPSGTQAFAGEPYDLLECVESYPITGSRVIRNGKPVAPGKWLERGPSGDNARTTVILHGNWKGQLLPIWLDGLPSKRQLPPYKSSKDYEALEIPTRQRVEAISPHAQVLKGTYRTPTFIIHGTADDLIPIEHAEAMSESLVAHGVETGIAVVQGAPHLLDLEDDADGRISRQVDKGFAFLRRFA
ncbi:Methylphloroacetophenone synthase [Colletotrichum trifolii]|uniref:Methylphloroacetophenone synthase n=1 Tax=Colletotrichum trifolii TaxID=5466 RepID=A0A4R8RW84_COLTR|nr:Methylphloroacetophenone synthase [Colletotrichum trifolii]